MSLGIMEQLTHSTVRIVTTTAEGGRASGTGFYMHLLVKSDKHVPVIITNKHVVAGAVQGQFSVTLANESGEPIIGSHETFSVSDFENICVKHPDENIDLVAFPIAPLIHKVEKSDKKLFYVPLLMNLIPSEIERSKYSAMEDIVMIGYPNGIWDSVNNYPVIRKGITATHSNVNWNGKREFLTDIASFPGSSGSPVFLANIGSYIDEHGNTHMGSHRIKLLGVHYAGAMHTAAGEIRIVVAPTTNIATPITQIPNNIGIALNSSCIVELEQELERIAGK